MTEASSGVASAWLVGSWQTRAPATGVFGAGVALLAAHGGAGASVLAKLHDELVEVDQWPSRGPVVVVCRSNASGLHAAGRLLEGQRVDPPLGVVVVADAPGRLPLTLARRLRLLGGVAGVVWRVPWVDSWRRCGVGGPPPSAVTRVLEQVVAAGRRAQHTAWP